MKNQRDKLRQYQKRITVLTDREKEIAKECLAKGQTDKAKLALRRKKYQESLLSKTDSQLAQLEILTSDVEFALVQKDVLYGLQQGTAVLKEIHREMGGIENVEKLLADNEEARAYQEVRSTFLHSSGTCMLISHHRKYPSSSRTRCPTKMKTRWKTSSKLSKPNSTNLTKLTSSSRPRRSSNLNSHPNRKRRWQRTGRRDEHERGLLSRHRSPCWHSHDRAYVGHVECIRAWRWGVYSHHCWSVCCIWHCSSHRNAVICLKPDLGVLPLQSTCLW
jgi:hypothetical protein